MTMNNVTSRHGNGALTVRVVCAIAFSFVSFVYLYVFQADIIGISQHILSGGMTRYNPLVGALLITSVLMLVQLGVYAFTRLNRDFHAVTYFPSILLLTLLTSVRPETGTVAYASTWLWLTPLLLLLWGGGVYVCRQLQRLIGSRSSVGLFSRTMWRNTLTLAAFFLFAGMAGNGDERVHNASHIEMAVLRSDSAKVLTPIDYSLCSHLVERDLDAFVGELFTHHTLADTFPRYYGEALAVYLESHPDSTVEHTAMKNYCDSLHLGEDNHYRPYYTKKR